MQEKIYDVPAEWAQRAYINDAKYKEMYARSVNDPNGFWAEQAKRLHWTKPFSKVKNTSYDPHNVFIKWFEDGALNAAYNCIDRHLATRGDQVAIIWEGDDPKDDRKFTYRQLHAEVCKFANVLKARGVRKGDRVTIYLPMIPEAAFAMLACARIGAIHSVVFGGFSPDSLAGRISDCQSTVVITADEGIRGGRKIPLKANTDEACERAGGVNSVIVVRRTGGAVEMKPRRDVYYDEVASTVSADCPCEDTGAEDPLFILYTSGSTGKPKGVLHTTGGYLLFTSMTHQYVFDYHDGDIYWCTADVGWVTGHSYIVYGPLANGAVTLMFEGVPNYPSNSRFWEVIDKHKVNIFYTAPTAIRALMQAGAEPVKRTSRKSLKLLGTVGEPINPEAWEWYYHVVGEDRCPIVDTWWQTETGGILITPLPGATRLKPGSATRPFFGIVPQVVDANGQVLEGEAAGNLVLADSWPGQMRTVYGDHQRFVDTYFKAYPGKYFTGDGVRRDADGYYWITGRVDDVINVAGHRLGTAEVESALVAHAKVSESAVVGFPHPIKGQGIYAYVTLMAGETPSDELRQELVAWVRKEIGPIASPDVIQFSPTLPKTRSGKIMRRILRKIAEDDFSNLGDISTLADPTVVTDLVNNRQNKKAAPGDATPPQQPAAKGQASPAPPKEPPLSERPAAKQESGGLLKRLFGG
ncbi:MAG TPA: acetate--CoA ligase [Xanthobacteraceae bacterium]|nr:acetate--CoA ligase [Xanthobacteraceae bacterium]